jgi:hypothetical protein
MPDWYESEPPFYRTLIAELQRLKRRAQARWPLVVAIGLALTAAVVWKVAKKPAMYRARLVLAITEGEVAAATRDSTPLHELRDYIDNILLTNDELYDMIDERELYVDERALFGDDVVLDEVRDAIGITVWRNFFQYSYSYDERRTARVAISFSDSDPDFAYEMARAITYLVIARESEHRVDVARELEEASRSVLETMRGRVIDARAAQGEAAAALAAAEARDDQGQIALQRLRANEAGVTVIRAEEAFFSVQQTTTSEALQAQAIAAGLALELDVVDERKPARHERSPLVLVGLALVALCIFLPLAGVVIGAFDSRVHDLDDVGRLELVALGHMPAFTGDHVGALRDRGVRRRRMPSWVPWR